MTSAMLTLGGRLRTALAVTALATATAVGSAQAATTDVPTITVRYSDLDLSTEQGSLALYGRIVAAAREVCPGDIRDISGWAASKACRTDAIARAVRDVNSPMLAAVYAARMPHG